ncbi:MAG: glycosyltransferase [Desulfovibrionaceae bacterium]|nr:glycosyltransferase [Desulfovibrionaceae bacterium]
MRFALLVTTLGREAEMRRLLASLSAQTCQNFHVYVGDQSNGSLSALWAAFGDRLPMTVLPMDSKGVSAARNALLRACAADSWDIVAFPDDDCWYPPDLLARMGAWFASQSGADALLTGWRTGPKSGPESEPGAGSGEEPGAAPPQPEYVSLYGAFRRAETYVQFYRRAAVERIGCWDETLGPGTGLPWGCGEDTDYLLRALRAGLHIIRDSTLTVYHPAVRLTPPNAQRWRAYGRGRMYLLHKHGLPLWFRLANIVYPLLCILKEHPRNWQYRWHMFCGRLGGWLQS